MKGKTIVQALREVVKEHGQRDAYAVEGRELFWTYSELARHSHAVGRAFRMRRMEAGALVAVQTVSGPEHTTAALGLKAAGHVPAFLDGSARLSPALSALQPSGLLLSPDTAGRYDALYEAVPELVDWPCAVPLRARSFEFLRLVAHTQNDRFPGLVALRDVLAYDSVPDPLATVSGEDDRAMDVVLDQAYEHSSLLHAAQQFAEAVGLPFGGRLAVAFGNSFGGLRAALMGPYAALARQATLVHIGPKDSSSDALDTATVLVVHETALTELLAQCPAKPKALRTVVVVPAGSGGPTVESTAPALQSVKAAWAGLERVVAAVAPAGVAGAAALATAEDVHGGRLPAGLAQLQTKVAKADGSAVAAGASGLLWVRGPLAAHRVLPLTENAPCIQDHWVPTNLTAQMDSKGSSIFFSLD